MASTELKALNFFNDRSERIKGSVVQTRLSISNQIKSCCEGTNRASGRIFGKKGRKKQSRSQPPVISKNDIALAGGAFLSIITLFNVVNVPASTALIKPIIIPEVNF